MRMEDAFSSPGTHTCARSFRLSSDGDIAGLSCVPLLSPPQSAPSLLARSPRSSQAARRWDGGCST